MRTATKVGIIYLFIALFYFIQCQQYSKQMLETHFKLIGECLQETGVSNETIYNAYYHKAHNEEDYKKFLTCLFDQKYKYVNPDGITDETKILKDLETELGKEIADKFKNGCFDAAHTKQKLDVVYLAQCYEKYTPRMTRPS